MREISLVVNLAEDYFEQFEERWLFLEAVGHVYVIVANLERKKEVVGGGVPELSSCRTINLFD